MKISLSKTQWEQIGKMAGWMKKAQSQDQNIDQILELIEQEKRYLQTKHDIPQMDEYTPDDGEYGRGLSNEDYLESLQGYYVEVVMSYADEMGTERFRVYFNGNYPPSSVNAGMTKRVFIDFLDNEQLKEFAQKAKANNIELSLCQEAEAIIHGQAGE